MSIVGMDKNKLKPCPNCGGTPVVWRKSRSDIKDTHVYVACPDCGLNALGGFDVRDARRMWNDGIGLHFVVGKCVPFDGPSEAEKPSKEESDAGN